ncbi:ECF RNA polymerase sigma factor SigW [Candidatus Methylomirabilis lanthanidiphila]|uniref:ECF RNA polymerase sigma factor SigW n=1 Tax=Candidatus Methylomirabilis lanthanidiphila TaxID=2211376 RepID=A0A564ZKB1_9BACT|nr:sigma-70 family RNA polymerase sigma factor [Candidatus Methylomirabilis lanthanidiphila]VUZ85297.1 ECF RNA polymerase sigma factor SigW [Candidatus Methylomirabilis lanthanidiphila]
MSPRGSSAVVPSIAKPGSSSTEERALVERLGSGDYEAFEAIFRRYVNKVYRQVFRLIGNDAEAEEIVQEVFLAVYQKGTSFRGDSAFSTWLYSLAMNACLTRLRRRKRSREISLDAFLPHYRGDGHHQVRPVFNWADEVEFRLEKDELRELLQNAINQLPPAEKAVIVLSDVEGIPDREIGEALGLSIPAVKARLHRARLFLRGKLADALGYSPA